MRTASFALKFLERNAKSPCFSRAFFVTSIAYQYWKGSDWRCPRKLVHKELESVKM